MPYCKSGRHFHVGVLEASLCCEFNLGNGLQLQTDKNRLENFIAQTNGDIAAKEEKIESLQSTRDGFHAQLEEYKAARIAKIVAGQRPETASDHAFLINDIEGLDALIGEKKMELGLLTRKKEEQTAQLFRTVGELEKIARHAALEKIYKKMFAIAEAWNKCAREVLDLRLQANDSLSRINDGEYPLLPAEMNFDANSKPPKCELLGFKPWQNH